MVPTPLGPLLLGLAMLPTAPPAAPAAAPAAFVVLPGDAFAFVAPSPGAARLRLADEAGGRAPLRERTVWRVVRDGAEWLEVTNALGGVVPGAREADGLAGMALTLHLRRADAALVTARHITRAWDDGSHLEVRAGVPVAPLGDGRHRLEDGPLSLALTFAPDELGRRFAPPAQPESWAGPMPTLQAGPSAALQLGPDTVAEIRGVLALVRAGAPTAGPQGEHQPVRFVTGGLRGRGSVASRDLHSVESRRPESPASRGERTLAASTALTWADGRPAGRVTAPRALALGPLTAQGDRSCWALQLRRAAGAAGPGPRLCAPTSALRPRQADPLEVKPMPGRIPPEALELPPPAPRPERR